MEYLPYSKIHCFLSCQKVSAPTQRNYVSINEQTFKLAESSYPGEKSNRYFKGQYKGFQNQTVLLRNSNKILLMSLLARNTQARKCSKYKPYDLKIMSVWW
jgi:hypothetical protein